MKQLVDWYTKLNPRERVAVVAGGIGCVLFLGWLGIESIFQEIAKTERLIVTRTAQLEQLHTITQRFVSLDARLERLQTTFAESQLSFEQVTRKIDEIVKRSIGSGKYDLDRGQSLTPIGNSYQKQEFTLKVSSITLSQVVELLFRLEHGDSPLLLGKVDLLQSSRDKSFNATLEIFSVLKSQE